MRGPWLGRMLYNSKSTDPRKIVLARDYHMPRKNIAKAMELVPNLQAICDENDVEMGGVPVIASDHEMRIIYRFKDLNTGAALLMQLSLILVFRISRCGQ